MLGVILRQKDRQIPSMAGGGGGVLPVLEPAVPHDLRASSWAPQPMVNISTSFDVFLTANGLTMLAVEMLVGAVFASAAVLDHRRQPAAAARPGSRLRHRDDHQLCRWSQANPVLMLSWGVR
ncbi:MAG: hypothetical protein MZV49_25035 [Rhodopseudomonas palustris]|nr:hypothetical protein [Rhodopseudomonas palustris]